MRRFPVVLLGIVGAVLAPPLALEASIWPDGLGEASVNVAAMLPEGTIFAVDTSNVLSHYHVASPGTNLGSVAITGLQAGENVLGIDFRPATGQLYALGSTSRLYVLNVVSGAASLVGGPFTPALNGTDFGIDFNPVTDQLRVVSDAEQNLRLSPITGLVVGTDNSINPVGNLVGSAHTNNFSGATTTVLYGIDSGADQLVIQNPPNNGTISPVGSLGTDTSGRTGFDIAPGTGVAYASLTSGVNSSLYTINLSAGLATLVGFISTAAATPVRDIAVIAGPETVFGLTTNNRLVSFNSHAPGSILSTSVITGLQAGENLLGIDFRPATGELYGLGSTSRLYTIQLATGVATQVGTGQFAPLLSGTDFGVDFNPTVDRLRVVSDSEQSLSIIPGTAVVAVNANLTPPGNVVAAAYTNNFAGAVSTTLYDLDSVSDLLLTQVSATGQLLAVGPLNVNASGLTGFDIAPSGMAFASITLEGASFTNFYSVNLATGAASLVGSIGGGQLIRDTAIRVYTEVVWGVTLAGGTINNLVSFNAATPGIVLSSVPITGLQADETVRGIDFRPATGELFALGSTSRIYTIQLTTGAATQVGTGPFTPLLLGSAFGVDFNPAVDRLRVVSNFEQNLSINPVTAAVTVNSALNPAGNVVAAAHSNNFAGAQSTTLYDVDSIASTLVTQNPTTGLLTVVGTDLGIAISTANVGFDITSGSGHAYLSAYTGGANPGFYRVNLGAGTAVLIANVNVVDPLLDLSIRRAVSEFIFQNGFESGDLSAWSSSSGGT